MTSMINRLTNYQQFLSAKKGGGKMFKHMVGVVQMSASQNWQDNYEKVQGYVQEAAERGADVVCLPEHFAYHVRTQMGEQDQGEDIEVYDKWFKKYCQLAQDNQVWLSLGCYPERAVINQQGTQKNFETHYIINQDGQVQSKYRKLHLFRKPKPQLEDFNIKEYNPTQMGYINSGKEMSDPCFSPIGWLGLSISYDLRFPELYRRQILKGAQVLLIPGSILTKTGGSHWETLLRTRAIENQCYVVAAAQLGVKKQGSFMGFGHSMVVDPWGDIIGQMSDQEGIFISELDLNYLDQVRGNMNSLTHIRTDNLLPEY